MIRKATAADFNYLYKLYMHPQVNPFLLYEMMDANSFKPIFDELLSKGVKYVFEYGGEPIGMFKLIPLQYRNAHIAYLGGVAIDPAFAGRGYGFTMLTEAIAYAKAIGLLRVELSVATGNQKAIALYEKAGFEKEGVFKKFSYLKSEDRYVDEAFMAWLA
ncbi:MAG TPA: GNAT family protein [Panacibacter sp.]|nr:GNAT family protein [Panacibacter sp.]HNP43861.1 GNAT family protein [Panacibacter sp.]